MSTAVQTQEKIRELSFAQAVNEALESAMEQEPRVICFGLGIDDPKRIFGTTRNLKEKFGIERVFDTPTSENAMTGIGIGAAIGGSIAIMIHQRLDFFLLAMDQLVNAAAKWYYMFGGQRSVPITIRLIIGHGWGQGPTHSQNLQAWFAHIPGLKVVMPTFADDAKGLLLASIFDPNPVVFLEHRWLHNSQCIVEQGDTRVPLGKARLVCEGRDLSIVSFSYMTLEALRAIEFLRQKDVSIELIDLRSLRPLDWQCIFNSVKKTAHLLVLDTAQEFCSIAGEIVAKVASEFFTSLRSAPQRLAQPDYPSPTSFALTKEYYQRAEQICLKAGAMLGQSFDAKELSSHFSQKLHDVPGDWFQGPF